MEGLDLSMTGSKCNNNKMTSPSHSSAEDTDCSPIKDGETTPRKNKRKSSEPKKRADFSIKRFCPDTPHSSNDIEAEDGEGRYSENPPSTPETSSSTPSPPDNNLLVGLRVPQLPRVPPTPAHHAAAMTSPLTHAAMTSGFLPPYPLSVPVIPIPANMMSQMVARQQQHQQSQGAKHQSTVNNITANDLIRHQKPSQNVNVKSGGSSSSNNAHSRSNKRQTVDGGKATQQSKQKTKNLSTNNDTRSSNIFELPPPPGPPPSQLGDPYLDGSSPPEGSGRRSRKNYKNMTRERRVEANARERSRVHTISAAFENLRRAVPSYSYNQRLSKLAILRIACTYIMSLATLAGHDYSWDKRPPSFADCVDQCTKTIQTEGRAKRRH